MSTLSIGHHTLTLSAERDAYARLRREYLELAYSERATFLMRFPELFSSADELFQEFPGYLEGVVGKTTERALKEISCQAIYDVDE